MCTRAQPGCFFSFPRFIRFAGGMMKMSGLRLWAFAAAFAVAVALACAACIGAQHPAPVWPDALGAFHAAANADAAAHVAIALLS